MPEKQYAHHFLWCKMNVEKYFTLFHSANIFMTSARYLFLLSANTKIANCHVQPADPCNA